jgi:hypothetical protein
MAKIQLDVPSELHIRVKHVQLKKESSGEKANLKDIYYEVIKKGLDSLEKENPSK